MSAASLSELEELILLAVGILHGNAYGYTVKEEIKRQAGRNLSLATVHTVLYRLEQKGVVRSTLGGETNERGGRRKRLFTITAAGTAAVNATHTIRDRMWRTMQSVAPSGITHEAAR